MGLFDRKDRISKRLQALVDNTSPTLLHYRFTWSDTLGNGVTFQGKYESMDQALYALQVYLQSRNADMHIHIFEHSSQALIIYVNNAPVMHVSIEIIDGGVSCQRS